MLCKWGGAQSGGASSPQNAERHQTGSWMPSQSTRSPWYRRWLFTACSNPSRSHGYFAILARASAGGFYGKSQHHYIKRFRITAALTDALDITHAPVFAKHLHARISDRCDVNEHVLTTVIRLYKAVARILSIEFDFSGRHKCPNPC